MHVPYPSAAALVCREQTKLEPNSPMDRGSRKSGAGAEAMDTELRDDPEHHTHRRWCQTVGWPPLHTAHSPSGVSSKALDPPRNGAGRGYCSMTHFPSQDPTS